MNSPQTDCFDSLSLAALDAGDAYRSWRERKLSDYPTSAQQLIVEINDPWQLTIAEHHEIQRICTKTNLAIYACRRPIADDKEQVRRLGEQLGLRRIDGNLCADDAGISSLRVMAEGPQLEYVPYTDKPLNWHTDGYYNTPAQCIRAFIIHCARSAASGGENAFLDHEIAYIHLRDANPEYIAALMHPNALTIPANISDGVELRPVQTGPVFSVAAQGLGLHMRYTLRKRNVGWQPDVTTAAAVNYLEHLLTDAASPYIFSHRLEAGQGIICNNVLHNRSAFKDDAATGQERLMYRARYYDRVAGGTGC